MEASATVPQVAKREYRNNTSGWIGVVILDHNGQEQGVNIEPGGTRWLSDAEAILTARAPQRPEDNPFLEREYQVTDTNGTRRMVKMRPLELVSDRTKDMYASDRFVPGITDDAEARAMTERAAREGTDGPITPAMTAREREITAPAMRQHQEDPTQLVPAPKSTGAPPAPQTAPPAAPAPGPVPPVAGQQLEGRSDGPSEPDEPESWTEPPEAPGQVLPGSLGGDDGIGEDQGDPTEPKPGDGPRNVPQAVPETVGAQLGAEEHAQRVDPKVGEETGAAKPPAQPQPEGEFASREEVGSPDAPEAHEDDDDSSGLIGG